MEIEIENSKPGVSRGRKATGLGLVKTAGLPKVYGTSNGTGLYSVGNAPHRVFYFSGTIRKQNKKEALP